MDTGVAGEASELNSPRTTEPPQQHPAIRPELVFGLVAALGTDLDPLEVELGIALRSVGYESSVIRISSLIADNYTSASSGMNPSESRMAELMDKGDELRRVAGNDAAAKLGIVKLRSERRVAVPDGLERNGHATIIRSIKRKDEVALLREVYGYRFLLIGGWAPREDRGTAIEQRLRSDNPGKEIGWYAKQTAELMARDEKDETQPHGQGVRDAFELSDVYIDMRRGYPIESRISRLVRILFGAPFETPTRAEEAMFLASGAALRSSAAGRQVGAVVVDADGEVLVAGTNEVPKPGGGQYWTGETPDHRDFTYGHDINDRLKLEIVTDVLSRLNEVGWLSYKASPSIDLHDLAQKAMEKPLRGSRISDLIEFGRIAHAEMAAICTAARRGTALRDATMYSTTYPCHMCARLIIDAGIARVVYIDPYPKSQVQDMFHDEVSEGPCTKQGTVVLEPFEGVAPRLFQRVFTMPPRPRHPATGRYANWDGAKNQQRLLADTVMSPLVPMELQAIQDLPEQFPEEESPTAAPPRDHPSGDSNAQQD